MSRPRDPTATCLIVFGGLGAGAAAGLALGLGVPWLAAWLAGASLATLLAFGWDKSAARRGATRVPERVLLGLSLAGGSPGALVAMPLFRHKTVKGSFRAAFFAVLALQLLLVGAWAGGWLDLSWLEGG